MEPELNPIPPLPTPMLLGGLELMPSLPLQKNASGSKLGKIQKGKVAHLRFDLHVFWRSFVHLEHMYRFCVGRAGQVQTARRERQAVDCSGSLKASEENENICLSHFS